MREGRKEGRKAVEHENSKKRKEERRKDFLFLECHGGKGHCLDRQRQI